MALSIQKLERMLAGKKLIVKRIYMIDGVCVYIEVLNVVTGDNFMLYIQSKYEIKVSSGSSVYKIEYIEVTPEGDLPDFDNKEDATAEQDYDPIDLELDVTNVKSNLSKKLEENYNRPVVLKDIGMEDMNEIKDIFKQLKRLKLCVQNIKYKLCILYKDFMCCIRRDDTFECYRIKHFHGTDIRKMYVTIDLESLYIKIDSISSDVTMVSNGVYSILEKNYDKHIQNLQKMLEKKQDINTFSVSINTKKNQYSSYLTQLNQLLSVITASESKLLSKIALAQENCVNTSGVSGMYTDIEQLHKISQYESELGKIHTIKQDLLKNIHDVKSKYENISLKCDEICFNNIVMIDSILKNFNILSQM